MDIRFWGVRGSVPAPLSPQQIQAKISSVIQRIKPSDLVSSESREKFISSLPKWIYGTVGGNTPCVELTSNSNKKIIFDAGSGIRNLGKLSIPPENLHYNLFFSHFHWDHIQGLPFFDRIYNPSISFDIYSPFENMDVFLKNQMVSPYYPVTWDVLSKKINFHFMSENTEYKIDDLTVSCMKMSHPGSSYAYSVIENDCKFIYATDVELSPSDFEITPEKESFFKNADVLVLDSQYTVEEAYKKQNWGHSAFCYAVDFANIWNIKKLYLFHHEPTYDDRKLYSILESARWYSNYVANNSVEVYLAAEGLEIKL